MALDAHWYWWALACILVVLQLLVGDMFFISLSLAAAIMGVVVYFFPEILSMPMQLLSFAAIAVAIIVLAKLIYNLLPEDKNNEPYLNQPGARHIGTNVILTNGIINGIGQVSLEGSFWIVRGPDCPPGTHAKVLSVDGAALRVEVLEEKQS
jgi:inner membrane protein